MGETLTFIVFLLLCLAVVLFMLILPTRKAILRWLDKWLLHPQPKFLSRTNTRAALAYVADLNVHLTLDDLKARFVEPFIEALASKGVPSGSDVDCALFRGDDGEPIGARIDFWAPEVSDEFEAECVRVLESLGAPKGSQLVAPNLRPQRYTPFGVNEGMGVYIDTVGLPKDVYEKCSIDVVLKELPDFLSGSGELISHWEGPKETALYCYGPSYQAMADAIAPLIERYPLLQNCRVVQIA